MLTNMRSRTMPALHTKVSSAPKASIACAMKLPAPSQSEMSSVLTTASPPIDVIVRTTSCAGVSSVGSPVSDAPRSLTTTFAPAAAKARACSRPIPRPAPVIATTRPSQIFIMTPLSVHATPLHRSSKSIGMHLAVSVMSV